MRLIRLRISKFIAITCFVVGAIMAVQAAMIPAKAMLAHHLIEQSWQRTLAGEKDVKPWPWMDSTPVAKLTIPRLAEEFIVMRGTSGAVLAFAPGWHDGTDEIGMPGISLIAAHRDTHFGFIRDVIKGDKIMLEDADGRKLTYLVDELKILQEPELKVAARADDQVLLLSTCFPFDNWRPGGEMRFVVVARKVSEAPGGVTS